MEAPVIQSTALVIALRPSGGLHEVADRPHCGRFVGENTGAIFYRSGETSSGTTGAKSTERPDG
ncbi:hypothetical protein TRL7639_01307 [Falsiruegeria litorea R37]|uniref:Uncharacterized protein n=1 Tax=Falsiruegeria litorea R37 TaxID=1200284 RepID=A0A1Y5S2I0_9RHOB|nr:hypothetical protein TRL7639_01307 [Falsiruegeria litorea R37]